MVFLCCASLTPAPAANAQARSPDLSRAWIHLRTLSVSLCPAWESSLVLESLMLIGSRAGILTIQACIRPVFRSLKVKPCRSSRARRGSPSACSEMASVALRPLWIDTDTGIDDAQGKLHRYIFYPFSSPRVSQSVIQHLPHMQAYCLRLGILLFVWSASQPSTETRSAWIPRF